MLQKIAFAIFFAAVPSFAQYGILFSGGVQTTTPPPAVLASAFAQHLGSSGGTSSAFNATGATAIAVIATAYGGRCGTLTSSPGNTWTSIGNANSGSGDTVELFIVFAPSVSSSMTVTCPGPLSSIAVIPISGTFTGTSEGVSLNGTTSGTSLTTGTTGTLTGVPNEICVTGIVSSATSGSTSISSPFTLLNAFNSDGATYQGIGDGYDVPSSTGALNPTWTFASGRAASVIGCLK